MEMGGESKEMTGWAGVAAVITGFTHPLQKPGRKIVLLMAYV